MTIEWGHSVKAVSHQEVNILSSRMTLLWWFCPLTGDLMSSCPDNVASFIILIVNESSYNVKYLLVLLIETDWVHGWSHHLQENLFSTVSLGLSSPKSLNLRSLLSDWMNSAEPKRWIKKKTHFKSTCKYWNAAICSGCLLILEAETSPLWCVNEI